MVVKGGRLGHPFFMSFLEKQARLAFGRWIEYSWLNILNFVHVFRGNYPVGILLCIVSNG